MGKKRLLQLMVRAIKLIISQSVSGWSVGQSVSHQSVSHQSVSWSVIQLVSHKMVSQLSSMGSSHVDRQLISQESACYSTQSVSQSVHLSVRQVNIR